MKKILCLIFAILLFSSSCVYADEDNSVKKDIESLASPHFSGRLYGTSGNDLAAEFIMTELSDYGLEPFNADNMLVPFEADLPVAIDSKLILEGIDGSLTSLEAGTDYIAPLINSTNVTGNFFISADTLEDDGIIKVVNDYSELFGNIEFQFDETYTYEINDLAFENIESYRQI